jgi:hypothetical protein
MQKENKAGTNSIINHGIHYRCGILDCFKKMSKLIDKHIGPLVVTYFGSARSDPTTSEFLTTTPLLNLERRTFFQNM